MKIRIKFSKQGAMKFIGHLDTMRYFQKVMRRADVDIRYSEGFSPHQIMSFAAPLGVGLTGSGEYLDIEVLSTDSSVEMVKRLNETMVEGVEVLSYRLLPDNAENAMSIVLRDDYENGLSITAEEFYTGILDFIENGNLNIVKKTKKGEKEMDLKPLIYEAHRVADGNGLFLQLSSGSAANVKPELVLEAYCKSLGKEYPQFAFRINREEVYADAGEHDFVTLESFGEEIGEHVG